jgi:hypothetical protein
VQFVNSDDADRCVQLNSVALTNPIASLKRWASQFGETLATTICPAGFGAGVGFVLFKPWEDAILYPPPNDPPGFMSSFQEGDNPRGLCVAVHDVPSEHHRAQRIKGLKSQMPVCNLSAKTAIAYFATSQVAAQAYTAFVHGGLYADVLSRHGIDAAFRQLSNGQLPLEWKDCVVYFSHLPQIQNYEVFVEL